MQSLSEEEQQRVLSEEKIGFKRGSGSSSPASKKKSSKAKVRTALCTNTCFVFRLKILVFFYLIDL